MLDSVRRFELGEEPAGLGLPVRYADLRAFEGVVPKDVPWQHAEQRVAG
jgi:hypothetical protein